MISAAEELQFGDYQQTLARDAAIAKQSTGPANIDDVAAQLAGNMGPQQEEIDAQLNEEADFLDGCVQALHQARQEEAEDGEDSDDDENEDKEQEEQEYVRREVGLKRDRHQASTSARGGRGSRPNKRRGGRGRLR